MKHKDMLHTSLILVQHLTERPSSQGRVTCLVDCMGPYLLEIAACHCDRAYLRNSRVSALPTPLLPPVMTTLSWVFGARQNLRMPALFSAAYQPPTNAPIVAGIQNGEVSMPATSSKLLTWSVCSWCNWHAADLTKQCIQKRNNLCPGRPYGACHDALAKRTAQKCQPAEHF